MKSSLSAKKGEWVSSEGIYIGTAVVNCERC